MAKYLFPMMLTAAAILFPFPIASADKVPEQAKSITVSELNKMQVIGWFGRPLGNVVVIEGVVVDGSFTNAKMDQGRTLLRVQTVSGKKHETVFRLEEADAKGLKIGSKFKYRGYETGGFTGVPAEVNKEFPVACCGYHFGTNFVILRNELKQK